MVANPEGDCNYHVNEFVHVYCPAWQKMIRYKDMATKKMYDPMSLNPWAKPYKKVTSKSPASTLRVDVEALMKRERKLLFVYSPPQCENTNPNPHPHPHRDKAIQDILERLPEDLY
jgi:hypothetical protein